MSTLIHPTGRMKQDWFEEWFQIMFPKKSYLRVTNIRQSRPAQILQAGNPTHFFRIVTRFLRF